MPNIYKILRFGTLIKSKRIKLLGIWGLHILGKRYIGIFFDPVLACNFRCKMCYFSDEGWRKEHKGVLSFDDIELIGKALFHRALKFQIGCGAEPTLHKDLIKIIALGKQYKIPYISLTTNGNLLTKEQLLEAAEAGLNEITVSVHGLTEKTYESLMTNGKFDVFRQLLENISAVRKQYPAFKLRINYTINNDNLDELSNLWDVIGYDIDVLQLRPIQKIGESEYADFDRKAIYDKYDTILLPLIEECQRRNIICIAPKKENILLLETDEETDDRIEKATYCYVSPASCWKDDFDYRKDTFDSYAKSHHTGKRLFRNIFQKNNSRKVDVTRKMNYDIN
ncbi:molybdenum cofactor biosynthesis enzyme MoaA [Parabacteroides sp. PF5-5]|uniref:radical SAM protein n=1 Tax=unclassified Parabacteroides TaxID=2649774 RepID=UPI00247724AD|nr:MULTISPECIES: radical SAM protein [unclassified Parabacteroides]MDH6306228.1 molybdenum cofactor biosynthesis enzyme MoaA [Parabacteroides sp. PH5-39]MDH6317187.1 molybdenum cofactor biosynthesis enzyme MoaA [Parabacteroides sp. PF5-13]MDH6320940.1 molybdenum cofactor biosynthesis enzyme MoaA [Parabacteroides sp. PH5-13]MDH6324671.1 molybdenum cofactor biosynthesis enzyme MoaA [Parabacteroides sp. PH5-8]MDH6328278.1 molybdenum cofactor biosynthesis enzyme MoaA [Parabacteroides sp. PH5-41]